jgi:hypothetical protein
VHHIPLTLVTAVEDRTAVNDDIQSSAEFDPLKARERAQ